MQQKKQKDKNRHSNTSTKQQKMGATTKLVAQMLVLIPD